MNRITKFKLKVNQEMTWLISTIYHFGDGDGYILLSVYLQCLPYYFNELRPFAKNDDIRPTILDCSYESWQLTHRRYDLFLKYWPSLALELAFYQTKVFAQTYETILCKTCKVTAFSFMKMKNSISGRTTQGRSSNSGKNRTMWNRSKQIYRKIF